MKYIYGLNKSGKSIIDYLIKNNENFYCWDDNDKIRKNIIKYDKNINFIKPNDINLNIIKEAFVTPGISLNNKNLDFLKKNKIPLYRDLELYSRIVKDKKIIAVTGTNGKSTTSKLISDMLNICSFKNFLGGNIGIPLLEFDKKFKNINHHIVELSSFQLESFISFKPYISILLNISEDHLDRYKNFHTYVSQKEKIIDANKYGYNIVCIDDANTSKIFKKNKKKIIPISRKYLEHGIFFKDGLIIDNYFKPKVFTLIKNISNSLFGNFNIENILATYVVSKILDLEQDKFIDTIKNFKGLPHRLETIYKDNSVQIINNSKATNIDSSLKSIANYNNIYLILGGIAKEKDFSKILGYHKNIKKIFLIGESADLIKNQLNNLIECKDCKTLDVAINQIYLEANFDNEHYTILFSPACSSFDQFSNFEERGIYFKKLINSLYNE